MLASLLLLLSLSASAMCFVDIGKCPTPKTKAGFDLEKFSGTWYEIEATAGIDKLRKKCSTYKIDVKGKNKAGLLQKYISSITGSSKSDYSDIVIVKSSDPGKLQVTPLKGGSFMKNKWTLNIIDTDYDTFAVGYTCHQRVVSHTEDIYLLTRSKEVEDAVKVKMYDILKKNDINQKNLMPIKQDDKDCTE